MSDTETRALVLKSEGGDYFLVPQEVLERGRVPAEHKAEVERLIADAGIASAGDDARGFFWFTPFGMFDKLALIIGFTGPDFKPGPSSAPSAGGGTSTGGGGPVVKDNVGNKI